MKTRLLDEAEKRTGLHRKVLIRKLGHGTLPRPRRSRPALYGPAVKSALNTLWQLFDCPCGQRMAPLLRQQVPRLRSSGQWNCTDEVTAKL
jgi:hypothetical protein